MRSSAYKEGGPELSMGSPVVRIVAACSVAVVLSSIAVASLWPKYPSWMWYLLVRIAHSRNPASTNLAMRVAEMPSSLSWRSVRIPAR